MGWSTNMQDKANRFNRIRNTALLSLFLVGCVCGLVLVANMNPSEIITSLGQRGWRTIASADTGGGPLASGVSGFCAFYTYPHSATGTVTYATNLSNATAFERSFYLNSEMVGETPYSTAFDFVLKFRVNTTVDYNTSSSTWMSTWVRAFIVVNFDFAADVANTSMTIKEIAHTTVYCWYHAYINNSNAGYQITKNEKFNCTTLLAQGYY
jgi:hypothetical protein